MNVDTLNQFMLSLFFIYLLLISADISSLLNCDTQKLIKNNSWVKHGIIFFTIYILTFILNWYTPDKIVVEEEEEETKEPFQVFPEKYNYLTQSLLYSLSIYIVFLCSSKMEPFYFLAFVFLLILVFVLFLLFKVNMNDTDESIELKENEIDNILYLYNLLIISYLVIPIVMIIGVYKNYKKQKSKSKNLSLINFFFKNIECKNL